MRIRDWSSDVCSSDLHGVVQHRFRQQLLRLGVLVLQHLQPSRLRHVQPAIPGLPLVEGGIRDAVTTADIRRLRTGLLLPQDPDDLLFREPSCRSEEHTSELQSLMRTSYAVFCLKKNIYHTDVLDPIN